MTIEPAVYRVPEVATLLRVSRAAVYRKIASGEIPSIRFGRSVRVPRRWVDAQLAA